MSIREKDLIACILFILLWLIPIFYTGITNKDFPLMPRTINYLQRISFLFVNSEENWPIFYIQVRPQNSNTWITLNENDFFKLKPFGYRTRLNQLLIYYHSEHGYEEGRGKKVNRLTELSRWIYKKYYEKYNVRLDSLRILKSYYNINDQFSNVGHWRKPEISFVPKDRFKLIFIYNFVYQRKKFFNQENNKIRP